MGWTGEGFLMGDLDQHRGPGEGFAAEGAKQLAALEADGTLKTPIEALEVAQMAYILVVQEKARWQARAEECERQASVYRIRLRAIENTARRGLKAPPGSETGVLIEIQMLSRGALHPADTEPTDDRTRVDDRDSATGQDLPQRDGKG